MFYLFIFSIFLILETKKKGFLISRVTLFRNRIHSLCWLRVTPSRRREFYINLRLTATSTESVSHHVWLRGSQVSFPTLSMQNF